MPITRFQRCLGLTDSDNIIKFRKGVAGVIESTPKLSEANSLTVDDRHAELVAIWEEIGENQTKKLGELHSNILAALDKVYDKAMEESVRKRMALASSVAESEKRLKELLGSKANQAIASKALPLRRRLTMNLNKLQSLDSKRVGGYGWVGGFLVISQLRERVVGLRATLGLPPCSPSADLDELLSSTMEALQKVYPGIVPAAFSVTPTAGEEKPIFVRLQRFYKTLRAMEDTCAESFAQGNDAVVFGKESGEDNSDFIENPKLSSISNRKGSVTNTRTQKHRRKHSEDATNLEQLSQKIFQKLEDLSKKAKTVLAMSKDSENQDTDSSDSSDFSSSQNSDSWAEATLESKEKCGSPHTPTSVLPTRTQKSLNPFNPPLLWLPRTVVLGNSHSHALGTHLSNSSLAPKQNTLKREESPVKSKPSLSSLDSKVGDGEMTMETVLTTNSHQRNQILDDKAQKSANLSEVFAEAASLPLLRLPSPPPPPPTRNILKHESNMVEEKITSCYQNSKFVDQNTIMETLSATDSDENRDLSGCSVEKSLPPSQVFAAVASSPPLRSPSPTAPSTIDEIQITPNPLTPPLREITNTPASLVEKVTPKILTSPEEIIKETPPPTVSEEPTPEAQSPPPIPTVDEHKLAVVDQREEPPAQTATILIPASLQTPLTTPHSEPKNAMDSTVPVTPATPAITSQPVFSPNSASSSSAPAVPSTLKPKPAPPPPPPMSGGRGKLPPPPPPPGGSRPVLQRSNSKLKRSSQIGNLYRGWKRKFECPVQQGKSSPSRKRVGGSAGGGKGGMAQALEEMSKRSSYFQKIAQDVELFGEQITSMKNAIDSFETRNMDELLTFYQSVESLLEKLTDESQVLSKFDRFPAKKLEVIRTAAALYSKLSKKLTELKSWKVEPPFAKQLDAINTCFEKLKKEIEDIERVKDKDSKTFQSQKIHFDYDIIIRVKEAMVDLSSNCISLALEESKATKTAVKERTGSLKSTKNDRQLIKCFQNLWKTLQLSYRVYSFAGGLDDRAEELASLLAKEMDSYPQYCWSS